jgi:hypothetical protein
MKFAGAGLSIAATLLIAFPVRADEVVLNAIDQGWYAKDLGVNFADGVHTASNENTLTGRATNDRDLRSFFVFDLTAETEPVIAAELRLELENYSSGSPSESFGVFDVSASAAELNMDYGDDDPDGLAIYDDLGSGEAYASKAVAAVDVGSVIAIPLSAQAVADLNASLGADFAVGLDLDSPNDGGGVVEFIRFSLNDEPGIQQLVLTRAAPVPAASAGGVAMLAALLAIGAAGWIRTRGRARSSS